MERCIYYADYIQYMLFSVVLAVVSLLIQTFQFNVKVVFCQLPEVHTYTTLHTYKHVLVPVRYTGILTGIHLLTVTVDSTNGPT